LKVKVNFDNLRAVYVWKNIFVCLFVVSNIAQNFQTKFYRSSEITINI